MSTPHRKAPVGQHVQTEAEVTATESIESQDQLITQVISDVAPA